MLMELGPCSVSRASNESEVELRYNPHAWNNNATLIFLDQPVGVGYSYAEEGISIGTTEEAAIDVRNLCHRGAARKLTRQLGARFSHYLVRGLQQKIRKERVPYGWRVFRWTIHS